MADNPQTIEASCLCGRAKHSISLTPAQLPLQTYICTCTSCRHLTGNLCLSVAFLPAGWRPGLDLLEALEAFDFSKRIKQYHCKTCGTIMMAECLPEKQGGEPTFGVSTGTLAQMDRVLEIAGFEHVEDTLDGGIADFISSVGGKRIERWPGHFRHGQELPSDWRSSEIPKVRPTPNDRLHGHCKCGGVNFWISRPSKRSLVERAPFPDVLSTTVDGSQPVSHDENEDTAWWLCEKGTKFLAGLCSCDSCRLDSGIEWVQWAFVPTVDVSLDPDGDVPFLHQPFGTLRAYKSSKDVIRYHCGVCGASVFWCGRPREQVVDIAVGLLDAPEGSRAEDWLHWRTERLSFREDAMPRAKALTLALEDGLRTYGQKRDQKKREGGKLHS